VETAGIEPAWAFMQLGATQLQRAYPPSKGSSQKFKQPRCRQVAILRDAWWESNPLTSLVSPLQPEVRWHQIFRRSQTPPQTYRGALFETSPTTFGSASGGTAKFLYQPRNNSPMLELLPDVVVGSIISLLVNPSVGNRRF